MRKIKPLHILFIVLNMIGIFLEYFLLYKYLLIGIFKCTQLIAFIISSLLFIALTLLSMLSYFKRSQIFEITDDTKIDPNYKNIAEIIKKTFEEKRNSKIDIQFVDGVIQPSTMFANQNNVYINTNHRYHYKMVDSAHFKGVLAHELGHVVHMPKIYILANMRLSGLLGSLCLIFTFSMSGLLTKKKNKAFHYMLFSIIYFIFIITNLLNLMILYPFKRYEEIMADKLSLEFDNGYALRGFYAKLDKENKTKISRFRYQYIDFNHLPPIKHYEKLNRSMHDPDNRCEIYGHNHIFVKQFKDRIDKTNQILDFYERNVDKSITSMYIYIAKKYEEVKNLTSAKKYYQLAGENGYIAGYKNLVKILAKENNLEKAIKVYQILAKQGDTDAKIVLEYYEQMYQCYQSKVDEAVIPYEPSTVSFILHFNQTYEYYISADVIQGTFRRIKHQIILDKPINNQTRLNLSASEIVSKAYSLYEAESDTYYQVKDYYRKIKSGQ